MDWLILKTFLTLVFIIALMFGVLFVVRKYFHARPHFVNNNLKVLTSLHLQPKKAIYLVRVFNKVMLVGVSDNNIATLGEITDSEILNKLETSEAAGHGKGFAEILKGFSLR
ncbi:MAG TPA: flagellar biosynthetic protein FliO [Candidatus Acidoferrales bacterium]|nr:flagellar biosynthetic protein FliO [Candidatus Acidoferrales bacterium]